MQRANARCAAFYSSRHKHRLVQNQTINELETPIQNKNNESIWEKHNSSPPIPSCSVVEQSAPVDTDHATSNKIKYPTYESKSELYDDVSMNVMNKPMNPIEGKNVIFEEKPASNSEPFEKSFMTGLCNIMLI